ncbi:MAG: type II and III secretion system protein [Candidatus Omnitrophica bacterium]|nr:type II and III secretion system protein [Candidatus Omnitrophota bacterium]
MKREHANILSKPTITTLNNEEAKINVTRKLAYRTDTTNQSQTGTTTAITWQEKEVGIVLSVTPYINDSGDIIMKVEPTASLLQEYTSTDPNTRYPIIMSRSASTQVMVKDGETLVIGGLITQEMRDTKSGIPLLSDIPILGIPFQKKTKSLVNTELIIFITPHIITERQQENK